jgi:phage protein D
MQTSAGRFEVLLRLAERNRFAAYVVEATFLVLPLKDGIRSPGAGVSVYKGENCLALIGKSDDPKKPS